MRAGQNDKHSAVTRHICLGLIAAALAACANAPSPLPPRKEVLGQNERFTIVLARTDDSYASIAQRYLGQASLGWRIAEFNKFQPITAESPIIVPMIDLNTTGVTQSSIQRVPVLCYHRFAADGQPDKLEVTAAQFEEQIIFLKRNGYTVVSLSDFSAFLQGKRQLPRKSVVITIDDGYRSIYSVAYPIIQRQHIPVTAFIYPDFLGSGAALTWAQIREMKSSGLVDFQSHSKSHTKLSTRGKSESPAAYATRLANEIEGSKALIAKQLGYPIDFIAYPYGGADLNIVDRTRAAGYRAAATVVRGPNPAYASTFLLRRDMVFGSDSLTMFARRLGASPDAKVR